MNKNVKVNGKILSAYASNNYNPHVNIKVPNLSLKKMDREMAIFLIKKQKIIKNKNKFKACLSS